MSMTDHSPKIEVITSVQRRRRWSAAEKMRIPTDPSRAFRLTLPPVFGPLRAGISYL